MANEALLRDRLTDPIDFTVADGTAITKGAVLKMTDPRTAILTSGLGDAIAGIAARDKVASDGRTRLAVFTKGIFDMTASGSITVGQHVISAGNTSPNFVIFSGGAASGAYSGASIIGYALETASDGEVIQVMVNVGSS